jgi:heme oxygenase
MKSKPSKMWVLGFGEILEPGLVEEEAEEAAQGARRAFVAFKEIRVPVFPGYAVR